MEHVLLDLQYSCSVNVKKLCSILQLSGALVHQHGSCFSIAAHCLLGSTQTRTALQ